MLTDGKSAERRLLPLVCPSPQRGSDAREAKEHRLRACGTTGDVGQHHVTQPVFTPLVGAKTRRQHKNKQMGLWSFHDLLVGFRQGLLESSVAITKGFINAIVLCSYIECDQVTAEPPSRYFASDNTELYTT